MLAIMLAPLPLAVHLAKQSRSRVCFRALTALISLCAVPSILWANAPSDKPAAGISETAMLSPVLCAVCAGNRDELEKALQSGAAFNTVDSYGRTPLMLAAALERPDLVQPLIIKGSDMGQRDKAGRTALDYSRAAGNLPLFKRSVLSAQANKAQKNQNAARAFLANRALWCDALGAVLLARSEEPGIQIAGVLALSQADNVKQGRFLVALLASARQSDAQSLKRLWSVFDEAGLSYKELARWKTLLRLIESGKTRDAERLTTALEYKLVVENAVTGFTQAALLLPGSVNDQQQVERLLTPPMRREPLAPVAPVLVPVAP